MTGVCEHTHSPYTTPPILKPESSTAWENNLPEGSWMVESEQWEENRHWHQIIIKTSPLRASVFLCKMRGLDWMGDRKYIFLTEHMLLEGCGEKASEGRSCLNGNVYLSNEWCLPWKCGRRRWLVMLTWVWEGRMETVDHTALSFWAGLVWRKLQGLTF